MDQGRPSGSSATEVGPLLPFVVEALGDKAVANPWLGLDILLAGFGFEFLTKLANKDAEILGLVGRLRSPDSGKQGAMSDHFARMARQVKKKLKFLGRQVDGFAGNLDTVGSGINDKIAC